MTALVRLARALLPSERTPVGFVVDNVGQPGTESWDALVAELAMLPSTYLLGAAREEDLFLLSTLPRLKVVRLRMDEELAEAIYEQLQVRNQTAWPHWREPYEQSSGLLLEYVHLLTAGRRLHDVIGEPIRARRRENRELELSILSVAGTAAAWGAEVPLAALTDFLGETDAAVSSSLERLVGEHLLQQRADGRIAGLHRLRSRAIFDSLHARPSPTAAASIIATIGVLAPTHLQSFLVGVLADDAGLTGDVIAAAAARLAGDTDAELAVAILQALRILEFRQVALRWIAILDEENVPPAMRPIAAQFALMDSELGSVSSAFDTRVIAAVRRLRAENDPPSDLRARLIAELPEAWMVRSLLAQESCRLAARLLATLEGTGDAEPELRMLGDLAGTPLEKALAGADIQELVSVIASGRGVSVQTAHRLSAPAGGTDAVLRGIEEATPWCRNLRTGRSSSELLDGREIGELGQDALVARVEYRYVSDLIQDDVHTATVELARVVMAGHPDLELVHAVAVDPRNRVYGFGDFEVANKWLRRETVPPRDQTAWNRTRIRLIESMLAATNHTDRVAAELQLIERTAALLDGVATIWVTGRGGNRSSLARLNTERSQLSELIDALPPAPVDPNYGVDPLDSGATSTPDPVQGLLRACVVNIISGITTKDGNLAPVAALIAGQVAKDIAAATKPERWRLLGYDEIPGAVIRLAAIIEDIGVVAAELAFGDTPASRLQTVARRVGRARALSVVVRAARQRADERFEDACRRLVESFDGSGATIEVLRRAAAQPGVAWPRTDLLLLVHVNRLDEWIPILADLPAARSVLSDTHSVSAVPVRDGVAIPFLSVSVLPGQAYPSEDVWEDWRPDGRSALATGACSVFRDVLGTANALSSLAGLPGGPRSGPETEVTRGLEADLQTALAALQEFVAGHAPDSLMGEVEQIARTLADQAREELASLEVDGGELVMGALNLLDGVHDEFGELVNWASLLLAEWDIAPDVAVRWHAES